MKLLICMITFNRLEYTKKTLQSLKSTIARPFYLVVVDNKSTDGTRQYLKRLQRGNFANHIILNPENYYPGKACNIGWAQGLNRFPEATHLMRLDNDMEFEPDWGKKAATYFDAMPALGQLGLDHSALDTFNGDERYLTSMGGKTINAWPGNIGGPCIIRRGAYDKGAHYDETPWMDLRSRPGEMITPQEDVKFSLSMHAYGYIYGHPTEKLATTFATSGTWDKYPDYYKQTFKERGYDHHTSG